MDNIEAKKGRKRGSKNTKTILQNLINELYTGKNNSQTVKLTIFELIVNQLHYLMLQGDLNAIDLYEKYFPDYSCKENTSHGVLVVPEVSSVEEWIAEREKFDNDVKKKVEQLAV